MPELSFPALSGSSQQYLYGFTSEDGCVKVGRTVNIKDRLGAHRSRQNAVTALFLLKRYGREVAFAIERSVKRHFADRRIRGDEWFACTPEELEIAVHKAEARTNTRPAENLVYRPVPVNWAPGVCRSGNDTTLHVMISVEMKDALEERARADRRSLAETIRIWLERMLEEGKK